MSQPRTVAVVVGSLRKESVSRKLAEAFAALTPGLDFKVVEIADLPHFDQDLEADPPAPWVRFRQEIAAAVARAAGDGVREAARVANATAGWASIMNAYRRASSSRWRSFANPRRTVRA